MFALVAFICFFLAFPKLKCLFRSKICHWYNKPLTWLQRCAFLGVGDFASFWNGYELHGLDAIKYSEGNCLLVGYHSRCTIDLVYVMVALQPSVIATHLMFKIPVFGWLISQVNILPSGTDKCFVDALLSKRPVLLLPGGEYEALKPLSQIGKLQWRKVPGFARLIHQERELGRNTKVVPFYTKNCEQILYRSDTVYEVLGKWSCRMLDAFRRGHVYLMPFMLTCMFISVGCKVLPRPVKLDTYLGEAVVLRQGESVEAFSDRVHAATQALTERIEALPPRETRFEQLCRSTVPSDNVKRAKLCVEMALVGLYTAIQNIVVILWIIALIWSPVAIMVYIGCILRKYVVVGL